MQSMKWIPVILFLGCGFLGCGNQKHQQKSVQVSKIETIGDSLEGEYDTAAIKVLSDGTTLEGLEQIQNYLLSTPQKIISSKVDTLIVAHEGRAIAYEISESINERGEKYKNLVIWQTKNNQRLRVFEFSAKENRSNLDLTAINRRRAQWMELCNQNEAAVLIRELYSTNTLYYNHKPLVKGQKQLVSEYQYMNNENYELTLNSIKVVPVNQNFVFEIGQCAGSYTGKYILIWEKGKDGQWHIFIDSNI